MNFHLAPEDEPRYIERATGPRREPPAVCQVCGADVPDMPRFGNEALCDDPACRMRAATREATR